MSRDIHQLFWEHYILKRIIKEYLRRTFVFDIYTFFQDRRDIQKWTMKPGGAPPHAIKKQTIKEYKKKYHIKIFIETGTYQGDMIWAMKNFFSQIYSIELDKQYYKYALKRFKKFSNISLLYGNSPDILSEVLPKISKPCLFWLDGHYSGGETAKGDKYTPIIAELNSIFRHPIKSHVILIDDARKFIGNNDYPDIDELRKLVSRGSSYKTFGIKNDIIRISP